MGPMSGCEILSDHRHIPWWNRTFGGVRCIKCDTKMKEIEYPYGRVWKCEACKWVTFHKPLWSTSW